MDRLGTKLKALQAEDKQKAENLQTNVLLHKELFQMVCNLKK